MKRQLLIILSFLFAAISMQAQNFFSPNKDLMLSLENQNGKIFYSIKYKGEDFILKSPLGLNTSIGDFSVGLNLENVQTDTVSGSYSVETLKKSNISYKASKIVAKVTKDNLHIMDIVFMLKDNDVAFRYELKQNGETRCLRVLNEITSYNFNKEATTFFSPQMMGQTGWMRTAPSYERPYHHDQKVGTNIDKEGYVFPCLIKNQEKGWILISETNLTPEYCACKLVFDSGSMYKIGFPDISEYNGNGTSEPGMSLPSSTPWRTITLGNTLSPIVESTIAWDFVNELYPSSKKYTYGSGSWSWILGMDESITYDMQKEYIDFSAKMGFCSVLVDNWWDQQIGRDKIEELAKYAKEKNVGLFLWYNTNGYWNDAPQTPRNIMNNIIERKKEMKWLQQIGIKGIKVDFFGSDKQVTIQLYQDILSDANDYGLEVIFHGCTVPRGWERMYPNFIGCEAVLASENLSFSSDHCKLSAYNACMHPFQRNALASMDFGGTTFNKYLNYQDDPNVGGGHRVTSDIFEMALGILYQCPIQHMQLHPNTPEKAAKFKVDFLKNLPTIWDDVKLIDGYPGKFIQLMRKSKDNYYFAAVNAEDTPMNIKVKLPEFKVGSTVMIYSDSKDFDGTCQKVVVNKKQEFTISVGKGCATIITNKIIE